MTAQVARQLPGFPAGEHAAARVARITRVLTEASALDVGRAKQIEAGFSFAAWLHDPHTSPDPVGLGWMRPSLARVRPTHQAAGQPTANTHPRVVPGRRDELYVQSFAHSRSGAWFAITARGGTGSPYRDRISTFLRRHGVPTELR